MDPMQKELLVITEKEHALYEYKQSLAILQNVLNKRNQSTAVSSTENISHDGSKAGSETLDELVDSMDELKETIAALAEEIQVY